MESRRPTMASYVTNEKETASGWVPDAAVNSCKQCGTVFTFQKRRHHCRLCGHIFCAACSSNKMKAPQLDIDSQVRVCDACFQKFAPPYMQKPVQPSPFQKQNDPAAAPQRWRELLLENNGYDSDDEEPQCCKCVIL